MDQFALVDDLTKDRGNLHLFQDMQLTGQASFMIHKLSPFFFDPLHLRTKDIKGADVDRGKYLYNEPSNEDFNASLQSAVHDRDSIKKNINENYADFKGRMKQYDAYDFSNRYQKSLNEIAQQILSMSELLSTWDYRVRDIHVNRVFGKEKIEGMNTLPSSLVDNSPSLKRVNLSTLLFLWVNMDICLHKPGCVYGKSLTVTFFMEEDENKNRSVFIIECNLNGIVPQEYIKNITSAYETKEEKRKGTGEVMADDLYQNEFRMLSLKKK